MRKLIALAIAMLAVLPLLIQPVTVEAAKNKSVPNLIGKHEKWVRQVKNDKEFRKKRVLLVVEGQKKATTIEGLLSTVEVALSEPQRSIFVDPLLLAENQQVNYCVVTVSGAVVKAVELSRTQPKAHQGLAALVISFEGDTTLPLQVLVNVTPE